MTVEEYNKSIDLYSDNVYRFILKNIKNKHEAEDIVQDTFENFGYVQAKFRLKKLSHTFLLPLIIQ